MYIEAAIKKETLPRDWKYLLEMNRQEMCNYRKTYAGVSNFHQKLWNYELFSEQIHTICKRYFEDLDLSHSWSIGMLNAEEDSMAAEGDLV